MDEMTMEDLLAELQALVDKYSDGTPEGTDEETEQKDGERMAALTEEINKRNAAAAYADTRTARVDAARTAIEHGNATRIDQMPLNRSAARGSIRDTTDYKAAARRAWGKSIASQAGVSIIGGTELTQVERTAYDALRQERADFTHTTANSESVIPVDVSNEIISLIDSSAVIYGDIDKSTFPHQFEIPRHKAIKAGDAAKTDEGVAPVDEENDYDSVTLKGEEIKKTVKMSRKMAVQSIDAFVSYLEREVAARLSVAANATVYSRLASTDLGVATANKISSAKASVLAKSDITKLLGSLKTFGNSAPKGVILYANNTTIWNKIVMVEDSTGRSYFVDEKTEDPAVQGHIFGKTVKADDTLADNVIWAGYPDLFRGNNFDGPDVTPYVENGTQKRCFDGYLLFDGGLVVPQAFAQLTIATS